MTRVEIFCHVDDFCLWFVPRWERRMLPPADRTIRQREGQLGLSEVMTILILFHRSNYRTFKHFYQEYVCIALRQDFPQLVSYNRFIDLIPGTFVPLCAYLQSRKGEVTGIAFVDSTPLKVCHNRRISQHHVFKDLAQRGKTSIGWFYGFKLHLIVNDQGDLLAFRVTPGNVDDRLPVPDMTKGLYGKLFGDKGDISHTLFEQLYARGLPLITKLRKNMKNRLMVLVDKILLRKRALIETVNAQLKNISQIEHTRHRGVVNALVNIITGLIAYTVQDKRPSLKIPDDDLKCLSSVVNDDEGLALPMITF
jgi:hypothetical protein